MKSPTRLLAAGMVAALAFFQTGVIHAKSSAKPRATPVHHHTVISAVSADSITIKGADGEHTFKITQRTDITFNGQMVKASDLQVGQRVSVTPDSLDLSAAERIMASDPPKEPEASPSKKK